MKKFHYIKRFFYYLIHYPNVLVLFVWNFFEPITSNKLFLKVKYRLIMGYWMDFDNPKTFSEKMQWLKLNDIHPEYTQMVDKVEAKNFVRDKIGDSYIIPTIGVWNNIDDIDWTLLPDKFVVKTTNDSGGVFICRDKHNATIEQEKNKLRVLGNRDYSKLTKEYPYHNVPHRIIVENMLENGIDEDLPDYKFYCFNGEPKYCLVIRNRNHGINYDIYDMNWNLQNFTFINPITHKPLAYNGLTPVVRPNNLLEMINVCRSVSKNIPFLRVDLYLVKGHIYFGEMTFFPLSGMTFFHPNDWNERLGSMIYLPNLKENI